MNKTWISLALALALVFVLFVPALAQTETPAPDTTLEPKYKTYKMNDYHLDIKAIQIKLFELDYLHSSPDGWFGEKTRSAVRRFQLINGLEETGIADDLTQRSLFSVDAKMQEPTLMSLAELKDMMGKNNKLGVSYNLDDMNVKDGTASAELNNYVTIKCDLLGDDITQIILSGKENVKIPFTLLLTALDPNIDTSNIFNALDALAEEGDRVVNGKQIRYEVDAEQVHFMIVTPEIKGSASDE